MAAVLYEGEGPRNVCHAGCGASEGVTGMRFRPCIDIHNGKVKQIVGGSLRDAGRRCRDQGEFCIGQGRGLLCRSVQGNGT